MLAEDAIKSAILKILKKKDDCLLKILKYFDLKRLLYLIIYINVSIYREKHSLMM